MKRDYPQRQAAGHGPVLQLELWALRLAVPQGLVCPRADDSCMLRPHGPDPLSGHSTPPLAEEADKVLQLNDRRMGKEGLDKRRLMQMDERVSGCLRGPDRGGDVASFNQERRRACGGFTGPTH